MKKTTLYDSRWDKARRAFLAKHPLCAMCQANNFINPATVVDHIVPHRLHFAKTTEELKIAKKLFWDENNWQPLCVQHHNTTKQRMEKGNKGYGCDETGMPSNPNSHWYQQNK
ncbi:MAG: HNH endonuclease signature motif containing protein [Symbiopectobacterium sp.]|uniref:HNH endonuclease signature motif containing protein n=1 Tax=Symbiopectobacterium sp. TaxID=2952789 RepID=UPI0039EC2535